VWLVAVSIVALAAVAALVVVLVNRGDDPRAVASSSTALPDATFDESTVPFTFTYPGRFAPGNVTSGILWVVGISPLDILDVRRVDDREYSAEGLAQVYGATLRKQAGVRVQSQHDRTVGTASAVVFEITSKADSVTRHSRLVYFSHAGSTWQLECQSQQQNRSVIDAACDQMLNTLTLR